MVIEAAGCLKTYEKTSAGHECTTLVMDKYEEVRTHTAQIQTQVFPSILGRPHAAPVLRGVFFLGHGGALYAQRAAPNAKLATSVSREAVSFWKVPTAHAIASLSFYFDGCKRGDDETKVMLHYRKCIVFMIRMWTFKWIPPPTPYTSQTTPPKKKKKISCLPATVYFSHTPLPFSLSLLTS